MDIDQINVNSNYIERLVVIQKNKVYPEDVVFVAIKIDYKAIVIVKDYVGRYFVVLNSGVIAINFENMVAVCIVDTSYEVVELLVELVVIKDDV